jgi:hypothetical protein
MSGPTTAMPPLAPADSPGMIAHLNTLQSIISRLAGNSSSCKTWCLTLVSALVSFAGATHTPAVVQFAVVPIVVFGFLDTMYLAQEKAYRDLYNANVAAIHDGTYDRSRMFSASAPMNSQCVFWAIGSWSIWPVYAGLIAAYVTAQSLGWIEMLSGPK